MRTKTSFVSLAVMILTSCTLDGQSFNTSKADSLFNILAENNKAMGSMAVLEDGNILYTRAIGFAEITPEKTASTVKTKYRIGSISKMFTATLIFQLIEQGKLDLSVTLDKFFPAIPNAKSITIANLLNHRSGIHSFTNDPEYLQWMDEPKSHEEMVNIIAQGKSEFEPGTKTEYSNSNFVLLGYIVENLYKKPYADVLQERICSRVGLSDTYYGKATDIKDNECYSFSYMDSWIKGSETDMSIPHGAGSVVSTPSDLVKFIYTLFSGKLVSAESLNSMKTITDGMGMGMQQFPYEDKKVYGHGGAIDGFNSMLCYFPDEKLAVSYCSNGTVYSVNDILLRTVNIYFKKTEPLPVFTTYQVNPEDLNQYIGVYASAQIPIKLTVTSKDGKLFGQGSGQPVFPLEASAKHTFKFEPAGIVIIFNPEKSEFLLEQGGGKFTFNREN